ncbi:MAG: sigma-70 family RNA polymerase sigma factor [Gemmatimonadaceae bacterium]|jgi:RNA polymerase sigma factor (sigma-70 family)|nr:sigma-70 family RNA polymerase sigma factor [Gemmatimonadaceae bacterium]
MTLGDAAPFPPTRQSLVERIGHADSVERRAAFDELIGAYRPVMVAYVQRRWQLDRSDAEDTTQSFLLRLWEKEVLAAFEPARARFRTFLRTCLDRHVLNHRREAAALRRGGSSTHLPLDDVRIGDGLDVHAARLADETSIEADAAFREELARELLTQAARRLHEELHQRDRAVVYEVWRRYDLEPEAGVRYAAIAEALSLPVSQVTNHLHAARRRLRALVLAELERVCASDAEFRADAHELFGVRPS